MKIFRNKTDYDGTVVALGNFDGLHIAHMTIIRNGIKYAKENGLKSGVLLKKTQMTLWGIRLSL